MSEVNYERIAARLQSRIADLVSRYEGDIAVVQESATNQIEILQAQVQSLQDELAAKVSDEVAPKAS